MELKDDFFRQQENEATFLKVIFWHFLSLKKLLLYFFLFGSLQILIIGSH